MSTRGPMQVSSNGLVFYYDTFNNKSYKGQPTTNVAANPLDLFAWCTSGANAATLARDTSTLISPAGGIPMKMTTTGPDPYTNTYASSPWNLGAAASGQTWTCSVWVKANRIMTVSLFIFEADSSGGLLTFDALSYTATTEWQRVSITRTFSVASTAYVQVRMDGPDAYNAGDIVWWDGLQVEQKSYPTQFTVGTRSVTNGLLDLAGSNTINLTNAGYTSNADLNFVAASSNYISAGSGFANFTTGITGEFWAKFTASSYTWERLMDFGTGQAANNIIFCRYANSNSVWLELYNGAGTSTLGFQATNAITNGSYAHYAFTINGTTAIIYKNGIQHTSASTVSLPTNTTRTNTWIGRSNWAADSYFQGAIPTTKIYNRALSALEILRNYNATKSRYGL